MKSGRFAMITVAVMALAGVMLLTSCNGNKAKEYKDGTYQGRSSDFESDEDGNGSGYGTVEIEIKDNKIVSCSFLLSGSLCPAQ